MFLSVLELRQPNDKVHDQDLGLNLGNYNPSDTSHWKAWEKAIRAVSRKSSKVTDVDLEIIQDLADGHVDLDEAWCDFAMQKKASPFFRNQSPW